MKLFIAILLVVPMIGGVFSRWQKKEEPDLDQQVLDQLKKAGSDLSKPHNIEFFLYFPTEASANEAAKDVGVDAVNVQLGADKKNWLCFATKRMVPDHDSLALVSSARLTWGVAATRLGLPRSALPFPYSIPLFPKVAEYSNLGLWVATTLWLP